ncbi:chemotaxis protein CheA [Clostridium sp. chh4-2]|uniref:chemotaxis protein CheA n=1 Tax=Clostridium sp. chh4-2 TaxID=2067550 RepID=UPI000CCEE80C|nr:chemotaxis protein CheA [Clostridium sp. chh4-2]PNV62120.1 chemotaxis protein CheA [Clostridium sp. chh4-2]
MGYFDSDTLAMLDIYLLETRQLMENLDEILMEGEKTATFSAEDINHIFRIMHTIKSSSAMMGLSGLSEIAHNLEDLFAILRDNLCLAEGKQTELFNLLFFASDFIQKELELMVQEEYDPTSPEEMKQEISSVLAQLKVRLDSQVQAEAEKTEQKGPSGTWIKVFFEADCKMEHIRAYMLMRQLKEQIPEAASIPESPEKDAGAENDIREKGLRIRIGQERVSEALELIKKGLFVSRCELEEAQEPEAAPVKSDADHGNPDTGFVKADKEREKTEKGQKEQSDHAQQTRENVETQSRVDTEYVSVRLDRLDDLQNLTGELIILMSAFRNELRKPEYAELEELYGYSAGQILGDLEKTVMHMRMVPVAQIIPKLKRIVRDLGRKQGKKIEFIVSGQDVEADKYIVEQLYEASMHVIRNAADHGIETAEARKKAGKTDFGTISFSVESSGGEMIVRISDDGQGMDEEQLRKKAREKQLFTKPEEEYTLEEIFELSTLPGLSTRKQADEYSGRGVGMDIVRKITEDNGGHLRIESKKGKGTSIILDLPLAHTIVEAIRFKVDGSIFSVLSHQVCRFFEYRPDDSAVHEEYGRQVILYDNQIFPVIDLADFYGLKNNPEAKKTLIHIKGVEKEACLLVDKVYGEEKLVQKPLPDLFGNGFQRQTALNGCSVLGNGSICMSIDVETLISLAGYEQGKGGMQNGN